VLGREIKSIRAKETESEFFSGQNFCDFRLDLLFLSQEQMDGTAVVIERRLC
jgi:hypothetical protein